MRWNAANGSEGRPILEVVELKATVYSGSSMGLMMSHNETAPAAETSYAALAGCTTGGDGIGAAWVVGSVSCMLDTFSAPSDGTIVA